MNYAEFKQTINYAEITDTDTIALHVYNNSPYKVTLPWLLLGDCETNAIFFHPKQEKVSRIKNILKLLDICQSAIINKELSIKN